MVRVLVTGTSPPKSSFPVVNLSTEASIYPNDIIVFVEEKWFDVKHFFQNSIVKNGLLVSSSPLKIANELLEINGIIKVIEPDALENGFDQLITKYFELSQNHSSFISAIPIPILIFDLSNFFSFVESLQIPEEMTIEEFLHVNPEIIEEAGSYLKLISVNRMGVELYEGDSEQEVIDCLNEVVHTYENRSTFKLICAIKNDMCRNFRDITKIRTLKGNIKVVRVNWLSEEFEPHYAPTALIDITHDQEKFEKAMEIQKTYYQFFEDSPVAITISNYKGEIIFSNHAFEDLLGYSKDEIVGRRFTEFTHPDFIEENLQYLEDLKSGQIRNFEFVKKYIRKTGEEILALIKVKRFSEPVMQEATTIAMIEDITDQKIVEELLEQEHSQFQSMFENAPVGMMDFTLVKGENLEFQIRFLNKKAHEIFLVSHLKENPSLIWELISQRNPQLLSRLKTLVASNLPEKEREVFFFSFSLDINNEKFRVLATHLPSINHSQIILFFYNITSEFEIINEYQNLSLFFELLEKCSDYDSFFRTSLRFLAEVFDASLGIFHCQNGVEHRLKTFVVSHQNGLLELPFDDKSKWVFPLFSSISPSNPIAFINNPILSQIFDSSIVNVLEKKVVSIAYTALTLDFSKEWILVLFNHSIPPNQTLFYRKLQNLLDLMRLSLNKLKMLENLREELEHRKEIERQLLNQTEMLSQLNSDLEQFVYAASHDLQEPLRTISSYLDLIRIRLSPESSNQEFHSYLETAITASKRLKRLITDLRNYSMIGRDQLEFTSHPLKIVLQASIKNISNQIESTNSQVIIDVDDRTIVFGNFSLLVTLFQNLISNGLKFNVSSKPTVVIRCRTKAKNLQIEVSDNGIGIDKDNFEKIFQAFTRLHSRSKFKGSGMGLAICLKIINVHNGSIDLESGNKGTTFKVILPNEPRS